MADPNEETTEPPQDEAAAEATETAQKSDSDPEAADDPMMKLVEKTLLH